MMIGAHSFLVPMPGANAFKSALLRMMTGLIFTKGCKVVVLLKFIIFLDDGNLMSNCTFNADEHSS